LPGDVRVERREGPRRTRETSPRGGKMGVETAARTVMVERADISEAKLTETQDHLLVEEAINGSAAAFGVLFDRYERRVLRVAWRVLRNHEDAEDAAQQAFEHAYVHLKGFQQQSRFSTWLSRIAINDALMLLRKRHPGCVSIDESEALEKEDMTVETHNAAITPEQLCEARELRDILSTAIGELKPILGKVVQLRELDELTTRQTAKALGLPVGTVKASAFRARRLLRRKLAERLGLSRPKAVRSLFVESRNGRRNRREAALSRSNHRNPLLEAE